MTERVLEMDVVQEIVCFDETPEKIGAPRIMSHAGNLRVLYNEHHKLLSRRSTLAGSRTTMGGKLSPAVPPRIMPASEA
jgi:hypothetical protein